MPLFMSYCRFENTASAFADCLRAIRNREDLSASEMSYAEQLRDLAERFIDEFDEFKEELEETEEEE